MAVTIVAESAIPVRLGTIKVAQQGHLDFKTQKMDNPYVRASKYERFIRRVFNCDDNQHGAHLSNMQNVIFMEQGKGYSRHLGSYEKQFVKVQGYIEKAILHLLKNFKKEKDKERFRSHLIKLQNSTNTGDLMVVIDLAFDDLLNNLGQNEI